MPYSQDRDRVQDVYYAFYSMDLFHPIVLMIPGFRLLLTQLRSRLLDLTFISLNSTLSTLSANDVVPIAVIEVEKLGSVFPSIAQFPIKVSDLLAVI